MDLPLWIHTSDFHKMIVEIVCSSCNTKEFFQQFEAVCLSEQVSVTQQNICFLFFSAQCSDNGAE